MSSVSIHTKKIDERELMKVHPQRFALWLGLASIVMMFAGFTSAYIVRKSGGNWLDFQLPQAFTYSSVIIVLSSVTMQWAYRAFQRERLIQYKWALGLTITLGVAFFVSQYIGWETMRNLGVTLQANPSGAFVRVISYLHAAHVIGGLLFLFITLIKAQYFYKNPANLLIVKTDFNKSIRIELLATYWHFIGVLWLYLFIFFLVNH